MINLKIFLPTLLLLLVSPLVFVNAELKNYSIDCVDSDSGLNYYFKGKATYNNFEYEDSCVTSDAIVNEGQSNEYRLKKGDIQEYSCFYPENSPRCESTACKFISYPCPYGCKDGACNTISNNIPSCMNNHPVFGEAWYDNNGFIINSSCSSCSPICDKVGTPQEGWYSSCNNSIIKFDACGVRNEEQKCTDSDQKDYYVRGTNSYDGSNTIEICSDVYGKPTNGEEGTSVIETWCENGIKREEVYVCESGCLNGACKKCFDSDGRDYYTRGTNNYDGSSTVEICVGNDGKPTNGEIGTQVTESWCEENIKMTEIYACPNGCEAGICKKTIPKEDEPVIIPINLKEEEKETMCQGCAQEDKCYPFGFRKSENFCSDENNKFMKQLSSEAVCENNFECSSNLCISENCVDKGLFQKILGWFKNMFE